jgi:asparagine synthase (glutamine-hydrolysing)
MCGLFGYYAGENTNVSKETLDQCRDTLRHRGPDSDGSFEDCGLYLGFRRLAILDLSATGEQPMSRCEGRYTIVFNGEIYNFLELRTQLERQGVVFQGHSDTEVLLALYARLGVACFEKLNGMFAVGIYDKFDRTILLARDRLGVKPLFYWQQGRSFAFASEIRALRGLPGFPIEFDPEALGLYFRLGMVPGWACIYAGVSKLPPGCSMRLHLETGRVEGPVAYWDLPPVAEEGGRTEDDWVDDVPLGVFRSGGLDSGLVAAAASGHSVDLSSLTVSFTGEPEDESVLASDSAHHLGLNRIVRNIDLFEGMSMLPEVMAHFDEPFLDTSALPTSIICAEARKFVTVILGGDGGDEIFAGYRSHVRAWRWRWVDRFARRWRRAAGDVLASLTPRDSRSRRFFRRFAQPVGRYGLGGLHYPFEDWPDSCLKPEFNLDPSRLVALSEQHSPAWDGTGGVDSAQRTDIRSYLLDDILVKVDRMSMRSSIEVRSPFLDYRLVQLGLKIPSRLRVKNGRNKYLLRRLADRWLPASVSNAPKRGFGIPARVQMNNDGHFRSEFGTLSEWQDVHTDPFVEGGAERLLRLGQQNPAARAALTSLLCYRWWCLGQATPLQSLSFPGRV